MPENQSVWCKAQLLSKGIAIDDSVISNYNENYIEKRSAYGIQNPSKYLSIRVPQELVIMPEELICSININPGSEWVLMYSAYDKNYLIKYGSVEKEVTFPKRPKFYEKFLESDPRIKVNQIISLYGGHSIGAFLIRNCWFEKNGVCHFCSLCNNHGADNDFLNIIDNDVLVESIEIALQEDYPITQIMLNGGNLKSLDDNFKFYVNRIIAVRNLLNKLNRNDVELHLIVSPPEDIEIIETLYDTKIKIAINIETYDEKFFSKYCPGKNKYIGHQRILDALKKSVKVLGSENVYSIFVGGLESLDTLEKGINMMITNGIVPVINVLHIDPDTLMNNNQRPSIDYLMASGKLLQKAYSQLSSNFVPFYKNCGRNSLDTEAYMKLFY